MARTLSATAVAAMMDETTDEVFLPLVTISHADLAQPIRVVANNENIISRGNTYVGYPFDLELPGQADDSPGEARLRIDNVDKQIVEAIRLITGPPSVLIEVILASAPDTVEIAIGSMTLRDVSYDAATVEGVLRFEDVSVEPIGAIITPERFPAIFSLLITCLACSAFVPLNAITGA